MDFFRSIISDDPPPPPVVVSNESEPTSIRQDHRSDSDSDHTSSPHDDDHPNSNPAEPEDGASAWSFGGFVRTFTTRSESVLETYRRDLEEFRSGLKKETELFKEVASRAVKDLPSSIEVGASAAHGSLEAVGRTLDGVLKSTAEIMSQGKETLLASSDVESDTPDTHTSRRSFDSLRYNRFEAQLRAIQSDANTYCEEPDDLDDYSKWKLGFVLEDKSDEIKNLIEENGTIEGIYKRLVPGEVDNASFWSRYFYRFHKLKQQEDMRANLVKRAIAIDDEEELSWDVDDDDDDEETNAKAGSNALESKQNKELGNSDSTQSVYKEMKEAGNNDSPEIMKKLSPNEEEPKALISKEVSEDGEKPNVACEKVEDSEVKENELVSKPDEKVDSDKKDGNGDSSKDGDVSVVSTKPVVSEEEEVGWDEIEDLGALENKVSHSESTNRAEVRKQINTTEEEDDDEDLSWDIEDDDEPVRDKKK